MLGISIINGNPYKPITQGLMAQGNSTVEDRLNKWIIDNDTDNWPLGCLAIVNRIDITIYVAMGMRPYQVIFGGRMPYMTTENWLTVSERKSAKLQNEDGKEDDEDSINLQARFEISNASEPIQSAHLPGNRIRTSNIMNSFIPGASAIDFSRVDQFYTPFRLITNQQPPTDSVAGPSRAHIVVAAVTPSTR